MKNYNPKKISLIVGAKIISGYAEDTFVEADYDEDAFTKKIGADGDCTRVQSANTAGNITITLDQASDSNDYLSAQAAIDRATGTGVVPVTLRDALGRTMIFSESTWIKKLPATTFGSKSSDRKWLLDSAAMDVFVGGNS